MEWKVVNAINRDVEREHLNKILKDISKRAEELTAGLANVGDGLNQQQQTLTNTIVKVVNNVVPEDKLVTKVTLLGEVTGTSVPVPGKNEVTINCTVNGDFVEEAPNDSYVYWRGQGAWQQVPYDLLSITEIAGSGIVVRNAAGPDWLLRDIVGDTNAERIVVTNGDGLDDNPQIDLAEVTPAVGGAILKLGFDTYGRRSEEDTADTDDLPEGTTNLYFMDERAQDAVGTILTDTAEIELVYDDAAPTIEANLTTAVREQLAAASTAVQSVVAGANVSVDNTDPRNPVVSAALEKSGVFIGGVELTSSFVNTTPSGGILPVTGMNYTFVMPDRPVIISFGSTAFYDSPTSANLAALILRVNGADVAQLFFSAAITNYWSQGKQYVLSDIAPGTVVDLALWLNMGDGTFTVFGNHADKPYIYVVTG